MNDAAKEKHQLDVLIQECDSVGKKILDLFLASEKVMGMGVTIAIAVVVYGVKEKVDIIFLFLPIGLFMLMFYGMRLTSELRCMGGYKRFLEERINARVGDNILLWENTIAKERHKDYTNSLVAGTDILMLIAAVFKSLQVAVYYDYGLWFPYIYLMAIILLSVGLCFVYQKVKDGFESTYQLAKTKSFAK